MPKVFLDTGRKSERIKYDSIEISGKFVQVYDDVYEKLFALQSTCAIHLLFWMANGMNDYNQVGVNKNQRAEFIASSAARNKRYSDETVRSALKLLVRKELAVPMSEAGKREAVYFVNPHHFWKTSSQRDRTESIKGFLYKLKEHEANKIRQRSKGESRGGG